MSTNVFTRAIELEAEMRSDWLRREPLDAIMLMIHRIAEIEARLEYVERLADAVVEDALGGDNTPTGYDA